MCFFFFIAKETRSAEELEPELPDNATFVQVGGTRISKGQTESEKLTRALGRLESLLWCQSHGTFTSAAGSGDGSARASSSSASFTSHARMHPSCTSSSCRSSPSGSSSAVLSRSARRGCLWCARPNLRQERRQTLPSSRGAICSVRILHCSVQNVQDFTPHCRRVNKWFSFQQRTASAW